LAGLVRCAIYTGGRVWEVRADLGCFYVPLNALFVLGNQRRVVQFFIGLKPLTDRSRLGSVTPKHHSHRVCLVDIFTVS